MLNKRKKWKEIRKMENYNQKRLWSIEFKNKKYVGNNKEKENQKQGRDKGEMIAW